MTRAEALVACVLTGCVVAQAPPPDSPKPDADGFNSALAEGCATLQRCADLEATAERRLEQCNRDFEAYSIEAERRGYRFQSGQSATCPFNITRDWEIAHSMHSRAQDWADPSGQIDPPVTMNERQDIANRAMLEQQQRIAAEYAASAERERQHAAEAQAEVAAAHERDALAETRAGLIAASIGLCEQREDLARLLGERAEMTRVDRASGTVDLAERRDLAADILSTQDAIACGTRAISAALEGRADRLRQSPRAGRDRRRRAEAAAGPF